MGPFDTERAGPSLRNLNETVERSPNRMTPLSRLGRPREVADAVLFLASDEASWINGEVIQLTGGSRISVGYLTYLHHVNQRLAEAESAQSERQAG